MLNLNLMPLVSLLLFALSWLGVGAFTSFEMNPAEWSELLRFGCVIGTLGCWWADLKR